MCSPGTSGPYQTCSRSVVPTDACNLDASGGMGTSCTDMTPGFFVVLMAVQTMTANQASAYCEWGCGAATCRIELSDGLPVELMEFSVDEPDPDDDADREERQPAYYLVGDHETQPPRRV